MRLDWWLALSPILLIILLMIVFRWGAHQAGLTGWLAAVAIAVFGFGAGPRLLVIAQGEAVVLTIDVLLIVGAAILRYRVTDEAGAIRALGAATHPVDGRPRHAGADPGVALRLVPARNRGVRRPCGGYGADPGRVRLSASLGGHPADDRTQLGGHVRVAGVVLSGHDRRHASYRPWRLLPPACWVWSDWRAVWASPMPPAVGGAWAGC